MCNIIRNKTHFQTVLCSSGFGLSFSSSGPKVGASDGREAKPPRLLPWSHQEKEERRAIGLPFGQSVAEGSSRTRGPASCPSPLLTTRSAAQLRAQAEAGPGTPHQPSFPELDPARWQGCWEGRSVSRVPIFLGTVLPALLDWYW